MYINWSHFYLPKIFGFLSFAFNMIFIYLALSDSKSSIGTYRYLLVAFAVFDMLYSLVEMMVPVAIDGTGAAFVIFISDGYFSKNTHWGQLAISVRCGFISLSYGLLAIHFIYRYIIMFNARLLNRLLSPSGLSLLFIYFILHGVCWTLTCLLFLHGDQEIANYIHDYFEEVYGTDSKDIVVLMSLYFNASSGIIRRSWAGIIILTLISIYAISLYVVLGYKITMKLMENTSVSEATKHLQRQLFKALAVQTFIPIVISFTPCMAAWYAPAFGLNLGMWNNYLGVIALSAFPFLDPLAIIVLLPNYRNKLFSLGRPRKSIGTASLSVILEK